METSVSAYTTTTWTFRKPNPIAPRRIGAMDTAVRNAMRVDIIIGGRGNEWK